MKNKDLPLSYIEISKDNLIHNIKQFRSILGKNTKISAVVKANAYGHGDREVVKIASPYVDYFQVDDVDEYRRIKDYTNKPIFIFGYTSGSDMTFAIKNGAILTALDLSHLLKINKTSSDLKKITKVHIAIDSLLGREGIMPNQVNNFVKEIQNLKWVIIDGVYSHFANIEDTMNRTHSEKQIEIYHKCLKVFEDSGYKNIKTHISATSGILVYENKEDLHSIVRLGIGLYGMWPSSHLEYLNKKRIILKPILRWITHIAQIKVLPPNHPIGYGLTYITKKSTMISIIPQGFSDVLPRYLSNNGHVLVRGKIAKILGRVAMNMIVIDVSGIKDTKDEDEVVILGYQGKKEIKAEDIAKILESINYEVTTNINPLLPRVIR